MDQQPAPPMLPTEAAPAEEDGLILVESAGIIPFFPSIMALQPDNEEFNASQCICSDLQHEDYSPLYAWFNYIVIIIMLPSLSAFGVITNVVNVFVYSRPRMRNSSNTYLLFLACSDFFVVLTGLFIFWIDSARSYIPQLVQAPYTTVYTLPFGYMAQSCSIYFTVAAAFDCYVCVCWRRRSKQHCTVSRARRIVGAIVLLSVLYNSLRFPQFNLRKCIHEGSGDMIVEICPTSLFFRINTVYNVYLYMVVMTLFPFLVLLLLNLFIICRKSIDSNRQKQKRKRSTSSIVSSIPTTANASLCGSSRGSNHPRSNQHQQQQQQAINGQSNNSSSANATSPSGPAKPHIAAALLGGPMAQFPQLPKAVSPGSDETITMIMVVILFLCCNTLALVVNLIETFFEPDALLLNLLSDASNFLVIFNSSVNCVIYLIFNSEYREVFFAHFVHFKGRCYPFHLLQCLFERNLRNDQSNRANGNGAAMNGGGSQGGIGGGMPNGYGNSSHKSSCHGDEMSKSLTANGPESPVWLQCPCAASPNRLHAHCHHHHHHCHCWQPSNCHAFEWTNFVGRKAANLAADDFEEGDSGCDEENCSNTQQQMSIMGGISSSACPSPVCKQHNNQNHHHHPSARHSCYLAEVKMIVENEAAAMPSPPHIYVRPLMRRDPKAAAAGGGTFDRGFSGRNNRSGYSVEPLDFMDDAAAASIFIDSSDAGDSGEYPVTAL